MRVRYTASVHSGSALRTILGARHRCWAAEEGDDSYKYEVETDGWVLWMELFDRASAEKAGETEREERWGSDRARGRDCDLERERGVRLVECIGSRGRILSTVSRGGSPCSAHLTSATIECACDEAKMNARAGRRGAVGRGGGCEAGRDCSKKERAGPVTVGHFPRAPLPPPNARWSERNLAGGHQGTRRWTSSSSAGDRDPGHSSLSDRGGRGIGQGWCSSFVPTPESLITATAAFARPVATANTVSRPPPTPAELVSLAHGGCLPAAWVSPTEEPATGPPQTAWSAPKRPCSGKHLAAVARLGRRPHIARRSRDQDALGHCQVDINKVVHAVARTCSSGCPSGGWHRRAVELEPTLGCGNGSHRAPKLFPHPRVASNGRSGEVARVKIDVWATPQSQWPM